MKKYYKKEDSQKMKTLLINISRCNEVKNAMENSNHPCHKIVNYQEKIKPFQNPEPWNGDINKADILFLSSNPSYDPNENYPTDSWNDEKIYNYHKDRFFDKYYQKNKNKVQFWQKTRKSASWLLNISLDDTTLEEHICMTEIVHCKSKKENGVCEASNMCAEKWLGKILNEFKGQYIVVFGKNAKDYFERYIANNKNVIEKKVIYAPHPTRWCFVGTENAIREKYFTTV